MKSTITRLAVLLGVLIVVSASAAERRSGLMVPRGTDVTLAFDQNLNLRNANVGDQVTFRVKHDVRVDRRTVVNDGTLVTGVISRIGQRRFGGNAGLRIDLNGVPSIYGDLLTIGPVGGNQYIGGRSNRRFNGSMSSFWIRGQSFRMRRGDILQAEVVKDTWLSLGSRRDERGHGRDQGRYRY
jgi:hypothetical protein